MHTKEFVDTRDDESGGSLATVIHHNGDYSGDVHIIRRDPSNGSAVELRVPFWQLKKFVVGYVRAEHIALLESAADDRLLGL